MDNKIFRGGEEEGGRDELDVQGVTFSPERNMPFSPDKNMPFSPDKGMDLKGGEEEGVICADSSMCRECDSAQKGGYSSIQLRLGSEEEG
jgi:hypothetical protein